MTTKNTPTAPIKFYRHALSGHCHRVELMASLLGVPLEIIDVDLANGAHKEEDFLAMNIFGLVPVIDDNGTILSDSNAILVYLVKKYGNGHAWLPESPTAAAQVQRWLSAAAGEIARGPAAARLVKVFGSKIDYEDACARADVILNLLEKHLSAQSFLAGDDITIADVATYAYIAHAPEGGVSLEPYPAINAWLHKIEELPGFIGMQKTPLVAA